MSEKTPASKNKRAPRTKRARKPAPFQITERDIELVRSVLRYRFLQTQQFWWLFPGASTQNLTIRLRHLFDHGYLNRVVLPTSVPLDRFIYAMTEKGAALMAEHDGVERQEVKWARHLNIVQPTHVRHLLAINNVLISYRLALAEAKAAGQIADFRAIRGDPKKHRLTVQVRDLDGHRSNAFVVPDAVLVLQLPTGEIGAFFIEVDRGTMTTGRWQQKVTVYREYSQGGHLAKDWQAQWSILLTVTTSSKRLLSIAEKTVAMGGRRGFWFTTAGETAPSTALEPIWVRATDLFQLRNEKAERLAGIGEVRRRKLLQAWEYDNG